MPISRARLQISDYNEKRKSLVKNQERRVQMVSLSLTSMVDMFAILVIFLLSNSGSLSDWLKAEHGIVLPKAASTEIPQKATTLQISVDTIYGDNKALQPVNQIRINAEPLKKWLQSVDKKGGYVNLVADQKLPFGLVKRIVALCRESGFGIVNLAIQPKGRSTSSSVSK